MLTINVFEGTSDTMHVLRTMKINMSLYLRVTFVGEPAIDDGCHMREYMRLLIADIMSYYK